MSARDRIFERIRVALDEREDFAHPGDFGGGRPEGALPTDAIEAFTTVLTAAGGEVVMLPTVQAANAWVASFAADFADVAVGATVEPALAPERRAAPPESAALAVSRARCAVAETGSLVLDARDGRRTQLLPPVHLVWLHATDVHATLRDALRAVSPDLPAALGLHSGPSKSADIGQILVRGVHGPGRLVVGLIGG